MNKKNIFLLVIIFFSFLFIFFYSTKKKVNYYPKEIYKTSIITLEFNYFNIFNFEIPFYKDIINFFYEYEQKKLKLIGDKKINYTYNTSSNKIKINIYDTEILIDVINTKNDELLDSDMDGFPDDIELTDEVDKTNFRKWFCILALTQYYYKDSQWNDRDCAGLIRFCIREALKKHDNDWLKNKRLIYDINVPDVKKYYYPKVPILATKIFKITDKTSNIYDSTFINTNFSEFAEAKYLISYNFDFISKDIRDICPGDVMFFSNDIDINWPYHSMIFIGDEFISEKKQKDIVVYHTGSDPGKEGIVKKLSLSDLNKHPNKRWHPIKSNPFFLGFYRWKIIN